MNLEKYGFHNYTLLGCFSLKNVLFDVFFSVIVHVVNCRRT